MTDDERTAEVILAAKNYLALSHDGLSKIGAQAGIAYAVQGILRIQIEILESAR